MKTEAALYTDVRAGRKGERREEEKKNRVNKLVLKTSWLICYCVV